MNIPSVLSSSALYVDSEPSSFSLALLLLMSSFNSASSSSLHSFMLSATKFQCLDRHFGFVECIDSSAHAGLEQNRITEYNGADFFFFHLPNNHASNTLPVLKELPLG
jgi:hypothetical protein